MPAAPRYIDPHIHMVSRTVDDYLAMAEAGIVAVIEPAFWVGQPRTGVATFRDYFSTLAGWERFRAARFGIRHYCAIGLNAKEANDPELAAKVLEILPLFIGKEGVVAIGEIGFDEITAAEEACFRHQLELAKTMDMLVMVRTPQRDKKRGTLRSFDLCAEYGIDPRRVVIDRNNEETVEATLSRGYWAAFTIYPHTKMSSARMVEIVRRYGSERIMVDSSADWGFSDPLAVPKTARLMTRSGIAPATVQAVCYGNALAAYGQSGEICEADWLDAKPANPEELFFGNSVLHGQTPAEV